MPDRIGYIYRRQDATAAQLRALIEGAVWGWAWTPAQMYLHGQGRRDDLLQADEGRVCHADLELRWPSSAWMALRHCATAKAPGRCRRFRTCSSHRLTLWRISARQPSWRPMDRPSLSR